MITKIHNLPENMVGFEATGEVKADDFKEIVMPEVEKFVAEHDKLNYLLKIDTDLSNFSAGSWFQDAILGLKTLTKWNRAAIISDSEGVKIFTDIFSKLMIGEFRVYEHAQFDEAVDWVSEKI